MEGINQIMKNRDLLNDLKLRFIRNEKRHQSISWNQVLDLINDNVLEVIQYLEDSGGEPDVFVFDNEVYYCDFSEESPIGRRSLCYDEEARQSRKKFPPKSSVMKLSKDHGFEVFTEQLYFEIQKIEPMDLKSSSWLLTENSVRKNGGAIFGDRRFDRVFVFHNGADSYYKDRGVRGYIQLGSFDN